MATLVLSTAATAIFGSGTMAAAIATAGASIGGYLIDQALFGRKVEGPRLAAMRPTTAEEGTALARVYGTARLSGTLIWGTRHEEKRTRRRQGGKSRHKVTEYSYFGNFAIAVAEGKISHIRRIWADGKEYDQSRATIRIYRGSEDQLPDPLIEAKQGAGNAPAYRGTAYVVFERFPLNDFGNRIPQFQFEVVRAIGTLANKLKAVALIPGSTEFGLSPGLVTCERGQGETDGLNRNCLRATTDWEASMDELQGLCPALKHVAIVVPWFGTDLRAGNCQVKPGVMDRDQNDESEIWSAGDVDRADAHLISRDGGRVVYGGTPSDATIIAAIRDAKARGLSVTLYPFVMLDIPADNQLPDPYGSGRQATHPWRGRISCHPAPYRYGSVNRTAAASRQIAEFLGSAGVDDFRVRHGRIDYRGDGDDWGYRRFILHLTHLALCADGVDAFILGSELIGLTSVRGPYNDFPFVGGLCTLAAEVRGVLGAACKLTYGADWSEYFGHHPQDGSGDVYFHLDQLWAHPAIDAVGIDNYMPLSDWRDEDYGVPNPDGFATPYDLSALQRQISAGEGFDWYYASAGDRMARARTPIIDGSGKPWVYRYKDLASWWSNNHHNRIGGIEQAMPTAWRPGSKKIWLTELGCPAVDKGPNQPNVFPDMKSSEGAFPYFSDQGRCDLAQNRYLRAHIRHWAEHAGAMLDEERLYVWAWDTRPYPEFPLRRTLWSDGDNWLTGHWLNGRLSGVALDELVATILADYGISGVDSSRVDGFASGYVLDEPASARSAVEPLLTVYGIDAFESGKTLVFQSSARTDATVPLIGEFVEPEEAGTLKWRLTELMEQPERVELAYRDPMLDYQAAMAFAERQDGKGTETIAVAAMLGGSEAKKLAEERMQSRRAARRSVAFELSWKQAGLKIGDRIRIADPHGISPAGTFVITSIEDGATRRMEARCIPQHIRYPVRAELPAATGGDSLVRGRPYFQLMDLPLWPGVERVADQFRIASFSRPWSGVSVFVSPEQSGFEQRATLADSAVMGELTAPLEGGPSGRWLDSQTLAIRLYDGELSSVSQSRLLNGANSALVGTPDSGWEVLQYLNAEETGGGLWQLTGLLRGQCGTEPEAMQPKAKGAPFILLNDAVYPVGLKGQEAGLELKWRIGASGEEFTDQFYGTQIKAGGLRALQPLAPVHIRSVMRSDGGMDIGWIRRGRIDADSWLSREIPLGEDREAYHVEILLEGQVVRSFETSASNWTYGATERQKDLGDTDAVFDFTVAMISATTGPGQRARCKLSAVAF
jgi:hypothetical protein